MREQAGEYYRETLKKNLSAFGSSLLLNRHFQQTRIGGEKVVKEFYTGKGTNWKANGFKFLIPSLADFESANSRQRRPKEIGVGSLSVRRDRRMVEEGTDARTVASAESAPLALARSMRGTVIGIGRLSEAAVGGHYGVVTMDGGKEDRAHHV